MSVHFGELAKRVGADGVITPEEVLTLRREAWPDGRISQAEAEAIFALNRELTTKSAEWVDFFVEALGEYVINQRAPTGYVDPENASWLMMQIDADGQFGSMAEIELLVRVFERAQNVPAALKDYATSQMELAALEGTGPLARSSPAFRANGSASWTGDGQAQKLSFAKRAFLGGEAPFFLEICVDSSMER